MLKACLKSIYFNSKVSGSKRNKPKLFSLFLKFTYNNTIIILLTIHCIILTKDQNILHELMINFPLHKFQRTVVYSLFLKELGMYLFDKVKTCFTLRNNQHMI